MKSIIPWIAILTFFQAQAHNHRKPVVAASNLSDVFSPNHAGYGYAGKMSEAEAGMISQLECTPQQKQGYLDQCTADLQKYQKTNSTKKTLEEYIDLESEKNFKKQVFEFLILQLASSDNIRPFSIPKPSCIEPNDFKFMSHLKLNPPEPDQLQEKQREIWNAKDAATRDRLKKEYRRDYQYAIVANATSTDNLVQAVALFRQLENAAKFYDCGNKVDQSMNCLDITDQLNRLKNAYPAIFLGTAHHDRVKLIEKGAQIFLASRWEKPEAPYRESLLQNRGELLWNVRVKSSQWDSMLNLTQEYNQVKLLALEGVPQLNSKGIATGESLFHLSANEASIALEGQKNLVLHDFSNRLKDQLKNFCNVKFSDLAQQYPQALRQMILDYPKEQAPIKHLICQSTPLRNKLVEAKDRTCQGVKGKFTETGGTVVVDREAPSFPFVSPQKYKVKRNPDGSLTLDLTIYFQQQGNPRVSDQKLKEKLEKYASMANKYYNSSIHGFKPPLNPPVKMNVITLPGNQEPLMNLSECYRSDLPADQMYDCNEVNKNGGNWEDAGNLTFETSDRIVQHEFTHIMGLDDEYNEEYYPMNMLGEHDSIMNSGDRLYPRHIKSAIDVAVRCGK